MKNKAQKQVRNFLFVMLVHVLRLSFIPVPWKAGAAFWGMAGRLLSRVFRKERAIALKNMEKVFGENLDAAGRDALVLANFENYGRGFFEFSKCTIWSPGRAVKLVMNVSGIEHFESAKKQNRPLMGVTAHFSNWELIPVYLSNMGYNIGVVGKKLFDPRLDAILYHTRTKAGIKVYDKDNIPREMIKGFKDEGLMLGVLVDQDTTVESLVSPFLGFPAKTPSIPAKMAKKFNAVILTLFMVRRPDGYYDFVINPPIDAAPMSEQEIVDMYNAQISEMIMRHPEQWAWIHDRWKSIAPMM